MPLMLDLCSGRGGASAAFRDRGWSVVSVDIRPIFNPTYLADLRTFVYPSELPQPDLIWASPPCIEFSKEDQPWTRTGKTPSLELLQAARRVIAELNPRYWVIENVRGAVRYFNPVLGDYRVRLGAFYLWGYFPPLRSVAALPGVRQKQSLGTSVRRSVVPYQISSRLADVIERQPQLI